MAEVSTNLSYLDQIAATVAFTDAAGHPAVISAPTASVDDTSVATVSTPVLDATGDSFQVVITPTGKIGTANLTFTGSNPDGSVVSVNASVVVVGGNAVTATVTFGTPSAIPVVAPVVPAPDPAPAPAPVVDPTTPAPDAGGDTNASAPVVQ